MAGAFLISGGTPLRGTVRAAGSKNAALPMMAAALLADEPLLLDGVPRLTDVATLARVLVELGVEVDLGREAAAPGGCTPLEFTLHRAGGSQGTVPIFAAQSAIDPMDQPRGPRKWDCPPSMQRREQPSPPPHERLPQTPSSPPCILRVVDSSPVRARYELVRQMRAGFCVLGPLLARRGKAVVSLPGGCRIGPRPVDLHLKGLAALGAELTVAHGYVIARAKRLRGATIDLSGPAGPTVTGTANVLSAAVLARGETILRGAACEPEIVDLGRLLGKMGARIDGLGTGTVRVRGVDSLGGARHRIIPDRIEAATLALAVAATRGRAVVAGVVPEHLTAVLDRLADAGVEVSAEADSIHVAAPRAPRPCDISAEPYPGFPSDVQAQWTALMSLATGRSVVRDRVFPHRFAHVQELARLGACIRVSGGAACVDGVARLSGATVTASDLRASAALVIAGLAARGNTRVDQVHWLDRGYERLDRKLAQLGASVARCPGNA